jgi:hypothetical protein
MLAVTVITEQAVFISADKIFHDLQQINKQFQFYVNLSS